MAVEIKPVGVNPVGVTPVGISPLSIPKVGINAPYRRRVLTPIEREHVKDLGDILFGDFSRGTLELRHTLEDANLSHLIGSPVASRAAAFYLMHKERYVEPILAGEPLKAALNTLETLGSTLDTFSNPVKSLFVGAGGGKVGDFKRSMGWIEGEYRKDFNYDTGSWLLDLTYEILSDPAVVAGLLKAVASTSSKVGVQALTSEIVSKALKATAEEASEETIEAVSKRTAKKIVREAFKDSDTFVDDAVKYIENDVTIRKMLTDLFGEVVDADTGARALQTLNLSPAVLKELRNDLASILRSSHYKHYTSISKVYRPFKYADEKLFTAAQVLTPLGPTMVTYSKGLKPTYNAIKNYNIRKKAHIALQDILDNAPGVLRKTTDELLFTNQKIHKAVYDEWDAILKKYNLNIENVQRLYVGILQDVPIERHNAVLIESMFKEKLMGMIPELRDPDFAKIFGNVAVPVDKLDDLVEAVREVATTVYGNQLAISNKLLEVLRNDMRLFLNKGIEGLDIKDVLKYLDEKFLVINNEHFGLANLEAFIAKLDTLTTDERVTIYNLLNYFGINLDNAEKISKLISDTTKDHTGAIQAILERGKTGQVNIYRESEKLQKELLNNLKKAVGGETKEEIINKFEKARIKTADLTPDELLLRYNTAVSNFIKDDISEWVELTLDRFAPESRDLNEAISTLQDVLKEAKLMPTYEDDLILIDSLKAILQTKELKNIVEVKEFISLVNEISLRTYGILKRIDELGLGQTLINTEQALRELRSIARSFLNTDVYDSVLDTIQKTETIYYLQMSAQGMFHWLDLEIFADLENIHGEWFKELMNPHSITRRSVVDLAKIVEVTGDEATAHAIRRLLNNIDTHTNVRALLNKSVPNLPDSLNKFIQGSLFNEIYRHRYKYATNAKGLVQEMTNKILKDIKANKTKELFEYVKDLLAAKYPYLEFAEFSDEALMLFDDELEKIGDFVYEALEEYIDETIKAGYRLGIDGRVYMPFSNVSLADINRLALEKENLIKEIKLIDPDGAFTDELETVSMVFGGTSKDMDNINRVRDAKTIAKHGLEDLTIGAERTEVLDNNLSRRIKEAFNNINLRNKELAGTGASGHPLHKITNYYTYYELDKIIKEISEEANIHTWSTENNTYAFKKVIDERFLESLGAFYTKDNLRFKDRASHIVFLNKFETYLRRADELVQSYTPARIMIMRDNLIKTYSRNSLDFGPKDPLTFFTIQDTKSIIAWDSITRKGGYKTHAEIYNQYSDAYKNPKGVKRTIEEIRSYKQNPQAYYDAIDSIASDLMFVEDGAWNDLVMEAPSQGMLQELYYNVNAELTAKLTSTENMLQYKYAYTKWFQEDVDALSKLDYITEAENLYKDVKNPEVSVKRAMRNMYHERNKWLAYSVADMDAKTLRLYIDRNTDGAFIFVNRDLDIVGDLFKFTEEELLKHGLDITLLEGTKDMYVIRRTDNVSRAGKAKYMYSASDYDEGHDLFDKLFRENRNYMNMDDMDIPERLLTGESIDLDFWEFLLEHYEYNFGDVEIRKTYQKLNSLGSNNFYSKKFNRPNAAIIGSPNAYNYLLERVNMAAIEQNLTFYPKTSQLNKVAQVGMINYIQRANKLHKYTTMFFNDNYYLGNQQFRLIFKNKTDKEVAEFFSKNNYAAAVLRENGRGKPTVYKYQVTNNKQLKQAVEQGAICVPDQIYRNMVLAVNKLEVDSKLINFYRRTVVGTYKSLWLFSGGYLFRNATDSMFYKNLNELGGITALPELMKYEYRASQMLAWYDKIQKEILESGIPKDLIGTLTKEEAAQYMSLNKNMVLRRLSKLDPAERELYMLLNAFIESGANGGFSKSFEDFLLNFNKMHATKELEYKWAKYWNEKILHGTYSPVNLVQTANSWIEQTARLGLFLNLVENGLSADDAIARVFATHFDYAFKTAEADLIEHLFWFSTFPINNVAYYMNNGIMKSPDLFKLQMDVFEQSWNSDGMSYDQVSKSRFLTYNAMVGNIRVGNTVIKTGSSVFDFFNLFLNPGGEIKDRLNPFLAVPLGIDEPTQLNPLHMVIERAKRIKKGTTLAPSVYDKLNVYDRYFYNYSYRSSWNGSGWGRRVYPKRPAKYRKPRRYANRYYHSVRVYRTTTDLRWRTKTTAISPVFWTPRDKVLRSIDRLRRSRQYFK